MGSFTTTYAESLLDTLTGTDAPYLALFTAAPGDIGDAAEEVDAAEYNRLDISADWEAAGVTAAREINTDTEIAFAKATESWGTISHIAVCAGVDETIEDLKTWGSLTNEKLIEDDDQLVFDPGNITIKILTG